MLKIVENNNGNKAEQFIYGCDMCQFPMSKSINIYSLKHTVASSDYNKLTDNYNKYFPTTEEAYCFSDNSFI